LKEKAARKAASNAVLILALGEDEGIISGRVGSLQWLDPAKVARRFRLPERCF
jgi:hypothetical protein